LDEIINEFSIRCLDDEKLDHMDYVNYLYFFSRLHDFELTTKVIINRIKCLIYLD